MFGRPALLNRKDSKMKIWKIQIIAAKQPFDRLDQYCYTGTATTTEVAIRQMKRRAKKDKLWKIEIQSVEYIGPKEFGR